MLEIRILGPLEVISRERLSLGGRKQQAVLVALLLHRGEVVSADRLIESVWGGRAPATAGKTLQVYVSNLRKVLGDGLLITHGRGYALALEPGQVDSDRFARLADEGHAALERGDPRQARALLGSALALWRGPALADFSYDSFAQPEIARLEEARLGALEDRIEADLRLGQHAAVVPELEALVHEHPLRERLYEQLMLALYRSGRQVDALERYQRARRKLIEEFGIEPGPRLQEIQSAVLAHDASLDLRGGAPTVKRRVPSVQDVVPAAGAVIPRVRAAAGRVQQLARQRPIPPHVRGLLAAGSALLVAAVVLVLVLSTGGRQAHRHVAAGGVHLGSVQISSPASGGVYAQGERVATRFNCGRSRGGPGLASCRDSDGTTTVVGGTGHLDTSTVGSHRYTVLATFKDGRTKTASITYTVVALMVSIESTPSPVAHGRTEITLACSGGGIRATCHGTLSLTTRRRRIASAAYALAAGATRPIVLQVSRGGLRALAHAPGHRLPAVVTATLAYGNTVRRALTLRRHRR